MAVKLHRCPNVWVKVSGHPCWKVQKALDDMGVDYEIAKGPLRRAKRDEMVEHTGQAQYPAPQRLERQRHHDEYHERRPEPLVQPGTHRAPDTDGARLSAPEAVR